MDAVDITIIALIGALIGALAVALVVAVARDIKETFIEDDEDYWLD